MTIKVLVSGQPMECALVRKRQGRLSPVPMKFWPRSTLTTDQRGYTRRWKRARWTYLNHNPLCTMCHTQGRITQASVVDHITPHKGDQRLFWDTSNWQALCYTCHNKTKQNYEHYGYLFDVDGDGWPIDPNHPTNKIKNNQQIK